MLKEPRLIMFPIYMYQGVVVTIIISIDYIGTHLHTSHTFEFYITKLRRID